MKKRVVIYARFSSHSQTEQSIEGQLRECYDFARRNDYLVIAEYIDRALTGTTDKRPEFLRMIEDSKKKNSFNAQISFHIILRIQKRLQIYKILVKPQPGNPLYFIKDRFIHLTIMDFRLVFAGCVTICRKNSA